MTMLMLLTSVKVTSMGPDACQNLKSDRDPIFESSGMLAGCLGNFAEPLYLRLQG